MIFMSVLFLLFGLVSGLSTSPLDRKPLGKKSYIRKKNNGNVETVSSAETLISMAKRNAFRTKGSINEIKGWRHWSGLTMDSVRYQLSQHLPHPVDQEGFEKLWFQLGIAADKGQMPSFENPGSRAGYALEFFCRARMLADILVDVNNPTLPAHWKETIYEKRLLEGIGGERTACNLTSLGGGPGFDFVAAAMVAMHNTAGSGAAQVHASVLDYEEGWEELVESMDVAVKRALNQDSYSCTWGGKCDITQSLDHPHNAPCQDKILTTDIWTCQYCVAENLKKLRDSDFIFFRDLFNRAPEGTLFLFTETTTRVWPDFFDLVQNDFSSNLEITFPYNFGRYSKGVQMAIVKKENPDEIRQRDIELVTEFRNLIRLHERKLANGTERQRRKIRGLKLE